jgi:5'-3' exonuclease
MLSIIDGDVLVYMSIWKNETLNEAKGKFNELLSDVMSSTFSTDYVMAIGGPDNFRVDLFDDYKGNRKKAKDTRPDWFGDLKSWVVDTFEGAILTDNCEADDMVRVWANECDAAGISRVVCSIDKDLDCIVGNHFNPRTRSIYQITEEYAERFYWQQVLTGDSTDNIPGLWKCGPVKAKKILAPAETHKDLIDAVCRAYDAAHGEEGYAHLIANGRLIHIWRKEHDYFKIKKEVYQAAIAK